MIIIELIIKGTPEEVSEFVRVLRAHPKTETAWDALRAAARAADKLIEINEIIHKEAL
ncbi:MAG: hypothetical protein FWE74_07595 [Oscillospiraceae bacterium]|nr:hypothetical protein [Oscillospiraceae bacterium]